MDFMLTQGFLINTILTKIFQTSTIF